MPKVIHFEINADQPKRAVKFYSEVFGWKIKNWGGPVDYWLASTGEEGEHGIDGAITKRTSPAASTVNTISVPSLDEFMSKVSMNGGKVITPRMTVPGVGYFAYCQDTEGNVFGIMEEDSSAK
jgi:predicted enzyme related to lactoylglutathione lyase